MDARPGVSAGRPVSGWWARLEDLTRHEVDADVLRDRRVQAIRSVWVALRPLGAGLHEAEQVVHSRYEALGGRVQRTPPDPLDLSALAARARALPGRVVAVEALWDGDTVHDWFVILVAVLDAPDGESSLAAVHHRPNGVPSGHAAAKAGRALADHLGVPFHFASPDAPDDEAPRWRTVQRQGKGRDPGARGG